MVDNPPSEKEVLKKIDDAFAGLDQQRTNGLENLKHLQTLKDDAIQREKLRLTAKYGEAHPRVTKIADRIKYNQGLQKELDVEIERAKITIPDFDVNTWMVHGGIIDQAGTALKDLTVSLHDEDGDWIEQLGMACTDERGYFAIRYKLTSASASEKPDIQKLILTVADSDGRLLQRETEPLYLRAGQIDYRLIVITVKKGVCPEPSPGPEDHGDLTSDAWVVHGKVVDQQRQPLGGLTVSLYDKDLFFDDVLGTTLTDDDGTFKMIYRTEAFRDFFEQKPDIYLKVLDKTGKTLFNSHKVTRCEAGCEEKFDITIKKTSDDIKR